jgi:hypothetical protein
MTQLLSLLLVSLVAAADPPIRCAPTKPTYAEAPSDRNAGELKGEFYVNSNRTIWALALDNWIKDKEYKMPWLRPDGQALTISGRRLDGSAEGLKVRIPCCYSSKFQAVRIAFPSEGCWEITGKSAGDELVFIVVVRRRL